MCTTTVVLAPHKRRCPIVTRFAHSAFPSPLLQCLRPRLAARSLPTLPIPVHPSRPTTRSFPSPDGPRPTYPLERSHLDASFPSQLLAKPQPLAVEPNPRSRSWSQALAQLNNPSPYLSP